MWRGRLKSHSSLKYFHYKDTFCAISLPMSGHIGYSSTLNKVCSSKNKKSFLLEHPKRGFRGKRLEFTSVLLLPFWFFRIIYPKISHSFWFLTRKEFLSWFEIQVSNQLFIFLKTRSKACTLLGNSIGDRFSLRLSLILVLVGISGLYVEIINAFEYIQGARKGF